MHNLSDTPGVGNLPASPEPEMEGGPLPQNLGFKTGRDAALRGVRAYNTSNGGVWRILLTPPPPLAEAPLNLEFRHAVKGRLFFG